MGCDASWQGQFIRNHRFFKIIFYFFVMISLSLIGMILLLVRFTLPLWCSSCKVLIHKSLFALVSGLAALRSLAGFKKAAIAMSIYSVASPLGIALGSFSFHWSTKTGFSGTLGSSYSGESISMDLVVASCESISTGTFLFVVFIGKFHKKSIQTLESETMSWPLTQAMSP